MPDKLKIAMVSKLWTGYQSNLTHGATSYIDANLNGSIRRFHLPHPSKVLEVSEELRQWNPDGLLCYLETWLLEPLMQSMTIPRPIVSMCAIERFPGVAVVTGSFQHHLGKSVNHLRQQGLRSLAFLVLEKTESDSIRIPTFNRIAQPADPAMATLVEVVEPTFLEDLEKPVMPVPPRLEAWLHQLPKPVGIVCSQSGGGGYLIRVCNALGLRVPEDVAIVGDDDTDACLATTPTLTSVDTSGETIGFEAMRVLDQMIRGQPAPEENVRIPASNLHVRQSTGLRKVEICDIAAAMKYIDQHACHGLGVEQLIQATQHVSRWTFQKHFQSATGRTPGEAIRDRQFQEARRLLSSTNLPMTTIAEQCGFSTSNEFARAFRQTEDKSPSAYRNESKVIISEPA